VEQVVTHIQRIRQAGLKHGRKGFSKIAAEFSRENWLGKMVALLGTARLQ